MNSIQRKYQAATKQLMKELKISNVHEVPRIEKVVLNIGSGRLSGDKRAQEAMLNTLRKISGQQPTATKAKRSIAAFKLRAGQPIGLKVTLRRQRMYDFLERLITVVIPRLRDFHGLPRSGFDKSGNYSIGIKDQSAFPELSYEDTAFVHGLQITISSSGQNVASSARMLELIGLPLEKEKP